MRRDCPLSLGAKSASLPAVLRGPESALPAGVPHPSVQLVLQLCWAQSSQTPPGWGEALLESLRRLKSNTCSACGAGMGVLQRLSRWGSSLSMRNMDQPGAEFASALGMQILHRFLCQQCTRCVQSWSRRRMDFRRLFTK